MRFFAAFRMTGMSKICERWKPMFTHLNTHWGEVPDTHLLQCCGLGVFECIFFLVQTAKIWEIILFVSVTYERTGC